MPTHLTTFFDAFSQLQALSPFPWKEDQYAIIHAVSEWPVGNSIYLVAECHCPWSHHVNQHYLKQGALQLLPHNPHVTLAKNVAPGIAAQYQHLVGVSLVFDRHGPESNLF